MHGPLFGACTLNNCALLAAHLKGFGDVQVAALTAAIDVSE